MASEGGICGHSKKQIEVQGPSEGGNKGTHVGLQGQGHGHCKNWPSEGSNEDAHAGSQGQPGHGHCENWPSEGGNEGACMGLQGQGHGHCENLNLQCSATVPQRPFSLLLAIVHSDVDIAHSTALFFVIV